MMNEPKWCQLQKDFKVSAARPHGNVWKIAVPFLDAPGWLRIEASGEWIYSNKFNLKCDANGDLLSPLDPKRCVHESSPVGCLIGRIGGSAASKASDGIFTVGSYCVQKVDDKTQGGPLFLTINDLWTGFDDNSDELTVNIYFRTSPLPPRVAASAT
jgi:hypothetical protein